MSPKLPASAMTNQDYYHRLGVSPNAAIKEIKEAYRRLAFQNHPDRNLQDPGAAERMKRINEAYAVLSNPARREAYDGYRDRFGPHAQERFRQTYGNRDPFSGSDIQDIFEEMARTFGFRGFQEIFAEADAPGYRAFQVHRSGFFAKGFVFSGSTGNREKLSGGPFSGALGGKVKSLLKKWIPRGRPEKGPDILDIIILHPLHAQNGGPYAYYLRQKNKKLVVQIPKGVKNGQQIRLAKLGNEGKRGGDPGDVLLKVKIKKPWLQRIREKIGKG